MAASAKIVQGLRESGEGFARLDLAERRALLRAVRRTLLDAAPEWVREEQRLRQASAETPAGGAAWTAGPGAVLLALERLAQSLDEVHRVGAAYAGQGHLSARTLGGAPAQRAQVFPFATLHQRLFPSVTGEAWLPPDVTPETLHRHQAQVYRDAQSLHTAHEPIVVVDAPGAAGLAACAALTQLFGHNRPVALVLSEAHTGLVRPLEAALAPLVKPGAVAVCRTRRDAAANATEAEVHSLVAPGPSAVLVVPGPWTEAELDFQAKRLATLVALGAHGHPGAPSLWFSARDAENRQRLLSKVRAALTELPTRTRLHPDGQARCDALSTAYVAAQALGTGDAPPWVLVDEVRPGDTDGLAFQDGPTCGALCEVPLPAAHPTATLEQAAAWYAEHPLAADTLTVLIHPATRRDASVNRALSALLEAATPAHLGVNAWPGRGLWLGAMPWRSPKGVWLHNPPLFDAIDKTVLYGPMRPTGRPMWLAQHAQGGAAQKALFRYLVEPTAWNLTRLAALSLRG